MTPVNRRGSSGRLAGGFAAGTAATVAMSALMFAGRRLVVMGRMPPERITERTLRRLGVRPSRRQQDAAATLLHLGFGGSAGSVYALIDRGPIRRTPALLAGPAFGTLVWAVSYMGWLPALRLMPPATRDRPGRQQVMLAAHWVYGATLVAVLRRRRPGREEDPSGTPRLRGGRVSDPRRGRS